MERKIGEIFEFGGEWYQCVKGLNCLSCFFNGNGNCDKILCSLDERTDSTSVFFKKLEKLGEPYSEYCPSGRVIYFQRYKCYQKPICTGDIIYWADDTNISIEIKQNKEDMEEKKPTYEELLHYYHSTVGLWAIDRSPQEVSLDWICDNAFQLGIDAKHSNFEKIGKNLKEFNLEAAKLGKPVCTRNGRKARIICFDKKGGTPIVGLIQEDGFEAVATFSESGLCLINGAYNLMMLPEKKEGWVNVYNSLGVVTFSNNPYDTKEEALEELKSASGRAYCVDTIKVNWEE